MGLATSSNNGGATTRDSVSGMCETVVIPGKPTYSGGRKTSHGMGLGLRGAVKIQPATPDSGGRAIATKSLPQVVDSQNLDGTGC